jgi:hypothetical protein
MGVSSEEKRRSVIGAVTERTREVEKAEAERDSPREARVARAAGEEGMRGESQASGVSCLLVPPPGPWRGAFRVQSLPYPAPPAT